MSIEESKQLFISLNKLFTDKFGETYTQMYEYTVNITFVHMGVRPACSAYFKYNRIVEEIFNEIKKYAEQHIKNFKILSFTYNFNGDTWLDYLFINLDIINKNNLLDEYNKLLSGTHDSVDIGKIFGFPCPGDIFKLFDQYQKKNDNTLRRRYIHEYYIFKKDKDIIIFDGGIQFIAYVCYKEEDYHKTSVHNLKLYQEKLLLLTDKLHIGFSYIEEII
jgi:hypothetical protein